MHEETETNKSSAQIQRLAWIIVLVSFLMLCSFTAALSGSIYYFLFRSTVPMEVVMQVGRGSAGIITADYQQPIQSNTPPTSMSDRPMTLRTDTLSQSVITFTAPREGLESETITLGTLTLKNNSSIVLDNASRPRFSWGNGLYDIDLIDFSGEAEIFITEIPDRPLILRIYTRQGNASYIFNTEGRYTISANSDTLRVITHAGRALLVSPDGRNNRQAVAGEQATLLVGTNLPVVTQSPINLINNGLFSFDIANNPETGQLQIPSQWGCFNNFDAPPSGEWYADTWQGRSSIRLIREIGDRNGETGCTHWLDVSVEEYSFLELRATFAINLQSLVNCGFVGSECPMMIFVDYLDANNQPRTWYQGLFENFDPDNPAPLVCQTCVEVYEHRPIAGQVWYTYESGNLFSRLLEEKRPTRILEVRFYASGHRYDVLVSEMSLFAGTEQVTNVPNFPEN